MATWFIQGYPSPKVAVFSSDFWLHKAKDIIQCFALTVCMYVSVYYIYIDMQKKLLSVIYKLKLCRTLGKICFNFESVQTFVRCLCA